MKYLFICIYCILFLSGCKVSLKEPEAEKGILDLTQSDLSDDMIALNGKWKFYPGKQDTLDQPSFLEVPGEWKKQTSGTYFITIKLPSHKPALALKVLGVSTAYILEINGRHIDSSGVFSEKRSQSRPAYERNIYPLDTKDSVLHIKLNVSNFEHHEGGLLQPLVIGPSTLMSEEDSYYRLTGGAIFGICMINMITYLIFFFFMREARYFLYYSIHLFLVGVHVLCLSDRILYRLLSNLTENDAWTIAYKTELFTIIASSVAMYLFYDSLFKNILNRRLLVVLCIFLLLQCIFVILTPAPLFTYANLFIPFDLLVYTAVMIYVLIRASRAHMQGSTTLLVFNILLIGMLAQENFIFKRYVGDLHFFHILGFVYITGVSVVLIRKIIQSFANEKKLSSDLAFTKEKLEKQNQSLERIINERTEQLMEAEKQSHKLQLEKRERDMDTLVANNLVKLQLSQNLIEELESLPKSEKELQPALNALITKLKGQAIVEEKLEVLQRDMDRINAEFYERLKVKFPDLSKTERELCAFIKLNLSNKDIAELRKTSLNTINVTRSRLRKKLGLDRDEELESFIQQF